MRHFTPMTLIALALALPLAACGSDSDSDKDNGGAASTAAAASGQKPADVKGGQPAADAFKSCFKLAGYEAITPDKNQESVFAGIARTNGYTNVPINVTAKGSVYASVYVLFFDDSGKASAAIKELKATTSDGAAPTQKGAAVLAYTDPDERPNIEPAVNACL